MIRITGGALRGRQIPSPVGKAVRPTGSLARQALFNILGGPGAPPLGRMLDLFAGSGIMGFEALSRGATFVDSVEVARAQAESIRQAALNLKVKDRIFVHHQSVASWLGAHQSGGPLYDLIYADPPFTQEYPDLRPFLELLSLAGHAVFECPTQKIPPWILEGGFELRKYGESTLAILSKF